MMRAIGYCTIALFFSFFVSVNSCLAARTHRVDVTGGTIAVKIEDGKLSLSDDEIIDWIKRCSDGIIQYFGKFPLQNTLVLITPADESGVGPSTATADGDQGLIEIPLGHTATAEDLENDWILTHEMVHLNFPLMTGNKSWLAEGMAVYVEPFARVQAGTLEQERAWGELMRDLPQGLPGKRDRGLDYSPTWASKYWGGALFYFLADLEIRQKTNNAKGLQDAFRAITAAGGHICSNWTADKCFEIADKEIGVPVLQHLHRQMGRNSVAVDLAKLWKLMGLHRSGDRATFSAHAPLAETRKLISNGPPSTMAVSTAQ